MKLEEKRWRKNSEIGIKSKSNKNENKYENENNISGKDSKWYTEIEIEENEQNKILQFDWYKDRVRESESDRLIEWYTKRETERERQAEKRDSEGTRQVERQTKWETV